MKTKDKVTLFLLILLVLLFTGLSYSANVRRNAEMKVTNETERLYAAVPPSLPEAAEGSININTATKETLMTLPGIGPVTADRIIAHREACDGFPHPACIMEVSGIGEKTYEKIKDRIKVME